MLYSLIGTMVSFQLQKLYCMATGSIKISRSTNKHADEKAIPRLLLFFFQYCKQLNK
jgi:hypothetical protein